MAEGQAYEVETEWIIYPRMTDYGEKTEQQIIDARYAKGWRLVAASGGGNGVAGTVTLYFERPITKPRVAKAKRNDQAD